MNFENVNPTVTQEGLPTDHTIFYQNSDMVEATTKDMVFKSTRASGTKVQETVYYTVRISYNAAGDVIKQAQSTASTTRPSFIPAALDT